MCDEGKKISFLCPNGTIFQQSELVCDWWFRVDCEKSPELYEESAEHLRDDIIRRKASRRVYKTKSALKDHQNNEYVSGENFNRNVNNNVNNKRRERVNFKSELQQPQETASFAKEYNKIKNKNLNSFHPNHRESYKELKSPEIYLRTSEPFTNIINNGLPFTDVTKAVTTTTAFPLKNGINTYSNFQFDREPKVLNKEIEKFSKNNKDYHIKNSSGDNSNKKEFIAEKVVSPSVAPQHLHTFASYFISEFNDSFSPNKIIESSPKLKQTDSGGRNRNSQNLVSVLSRTTVSKYNDLFKNKETTARTTTAGEQENYRVLDENLDRFSLENPDAKNIVKLFTHALSSYLNDSQEFKTTLEKYRPTEPTILDGFVNDKEEDEVLNYSDDDLHLNRRFKYTTPNPLIFRTAEKKPIITKTVKQHNKKDQYDRNVKTDGSQYDGNVLKTGGTVSLNLRSNFKDTNYQTNLGDGTKQRKDQNNNNIFQNSNEVKKPFKNLNKEISEVETSSPEILERQHTLSPIKQNIRTTLINNYFSDKKIVAHNTTPKSVTDLSSKDSTLPENHWTSSPHATKLWETTLYINPVSLNQKLNSPKVDFKTQDDDLQFERGTTPSAFTKHTFGRVSSPNQNTDDQRRKTERLSLETTTTRPSIENSTPTNKIFFKVSSPKPFSEISHHVSNAKDSPSAPSIPKVKNNNFYKDNDSTQVHVILQNFMSSSERNGSIRLQQILQRMNITENEFLSKVQQIESNPLTRRLIILLINECENLASSQQQNVNKKANRHRNYPIYRYLESKDRDSRALELLNSLYSIASKYGK